MLKYIKMTASSNFGNVFSVLVASAFLPFLPMLPLHLLIQNLLYDVSQVAIPFDNVDDEQIQKAATLESGGSGALYDLLRTDQLDLRYSDVLPDVGGYSMPTRRKRKRCSSRDGLVGLLSQTLIVHMIRTRRAVYSELCIVAVNDHDRDRDDCRDRIAVFTAGQLSAAAGAAVKLFPVAGCDSGRVYDVNPVGERIL